MLLKAELLSSVVTVAGLDEEAFLAEGELDPVVAVGGGVLGGGVAEAVLGAQLFRDLVVDLGYVLTLFDLEEAASGLLGHALEVLFAIDVAWAGGIVASIVASAVASRIATSRVATTGITAAWVATSGIAAAGVTTTGIASAAATWIAAATAIVGIVLVGLFAFEVDGVDDGVGALGGFDGFDESSPCCRGRLRRRE